MWYKQLMYRYMFIYSHLVMHALYQRDWHWMMQCFCLLTFKVYVWPKNSVSLFLLKLIENNLKFSPLIQKSSGFIFRSIGISDLGLFVRTECLSSPLLGSATVLLSTLHHLKKFKPLLPSFTFIQVNVFQGHDRKYTWYS